MASRTERARNALLAAGFLFIVLGITQGRTVWYLVALALIVAAVVRGRRAQPSE